MPVSESQRVASNLRLSLVVMNSFFREDDFDLDSQIGTFLKPYFLTTTANTSSYYYMLVS